AFWLAGLCVWRAVDRSMARLALQAISEEEEAAASIGIPVTRAKLRITLISALMTCAGGVLYAQYQLYVNPDTVSGIGISLQMVFGAIAGGMFVMLGPTVGAAFTLLLAEGLRLAFGNRYPALDSTLYGAMLVLFIIYMPKGAQARELGACGRDRLRAVAARRALARGEEGLLHGGRRVLQRVEPGLVHPGECGEQQAGEPDAYGKKLCKKQGR